MSETVCPIAVAVEKISMMFARAAFVFSSRIFISGFSFFFEFLTRLPELFPILRCLAEFHTATCQNILKFILSLIGDWGGGITASHPIEVLCKATLCKTYPFCQDVAIVVGGVFFLEGEFTVCRRLVVVFSGPCIPLRQTLVRSQTSMGCVICSSHKLGDYPCIRKKCKHIFQSFTILPT